MNRFVEVHAASFYRTQINIFCMKRDVEAYYAKRAATYSDLDEPDTIVSCVRAIGIADHMRIIAPKPGDKILDLGCGPGRFLGPFTVADAYGVDFTLNMLVPAKVKGAKLVRGDVENLPFKDEVFDVIHSAGLLGVYRSRRILAEATRVAKKRGRIYISFPATTSASGLMVKLLRGFYNPALMDYWYTKYEIIEMLPEGIELKKIHRLGWEPPFQRVYRHLKSKLLTTAFLFLAGKLRDKPLFRFFGARFLLEAAKL